MNSGRASLLHQSPFTNSEIWLDVVFIWKFKQFHWLWCLNYFVRNHLDDTCVEKLLVTVTHYKSNLSCLFALPCFLSLPSLVSPLTPASCVSLLQTSLAISSFLTPVYLQSIYISLSLSVSVSPLSVSGLHIPVLRNGWGLVFFVCVFCDFILLFQNLGALHVSQCTFANRENAAVSCCIISQWER